MGDKNGMYKSLSFYYFLEIWLARNRLIFEDRPIIVSYIDGAIMIWIKGQEHDLPITKYLSHHIRPHPISLPVVFFDEAASDGVCGCGAWINLDNNECY